MSFFRCCWSAEPKSRSELRVSSPSSPQGGLPSSPLYRNSADWLVSPREQMRQAKEIAPSPPPRPARPKPTPVSADSYQESSPSFQEESSSPISYIPRRLSWRSNQPPDSPDCQSGSRRRSSEYHLPPVGQFHYLCRNVPSTYEPTAFDRIPAIPPQPVAQPKANAPSQATPHHPNTSHHPFPLLSILSNHLSHTHTLLSGYEALLLHGCHFPLPPNNPLTLLCSSYDLPIIRSWSAAAGWDVHRPEHHGNGDHDEIAVSASESGEEGSSWSWVVRVEGVEGEVWDEIERGREMRYGVGVLSLEELLGVFGGWWEEDEGDEEGKRVMWILEKLAEAGREVDGEAREGFWWRERFVESRGLLESIGLGI
ncbi:hypothetical protein B0T14DRAFT_598102 [Immersiella caudata]|uniref:Uncharacterized protein n=1 Tax=Immersiella caudata TaxID=314043 RepID=A0AA40CBU8_9PEZI|nr:hypothetical protein B0T14DRAFT_598102 [Immersiella caudata]